MHDEIRSALRWYAVAALTCLMSVSAAAQPIWLVHIHNQPSGDIYSELYALGFHTEQTGDPPVITVDGILLQTYTGSGTFPFGHFDPETDTLHLQEDAFKSPLSDVDKALLFAVTKHEQAHWILDDYLEHLCAAAQDPAACEALVKCHSKTGKGKGACHEAWANTETFHQLCEEAANPDTPPKLAKELKKRAFNACAKAKRATAKCNKASLSPSNGGCGPLSTPPGSAPPVPTPCKCP